MVWTYAKSVPQDIYVACSGGVDSIAAAHILSQWRNITLLHFAHADFVSSQERETVKKFAEKHHLPLITKDSVELLPQANREEAWRDDRYSWFHSFDRPVVVAHTLDDAVEWYLMTCLRGRGEYLPYSNRNVIRPFLLTAKKDLQSYALEKNLDWFEDPGNSDTEFSVRSRVRHLLVPAAVSCDQNLYGMVRKRLVEKLQQK